MTTWTSLRCAPCWGVLALSVLCAVAGAGWGCVALGGHAPVEGIPPTGGTERTPPAATAPQPQPRQVELADPSLAATAQKREQLTYLVRCALPADVTLHAEHGGERFTFPGRMGLAPRWLSEAMTPSEERWVSACLLAHVNYFGKRVLVSMRATPPPVPALEVSDEEYQTFTIFEGGFLGNLFSAHPVAYTCLGTRTAAQALDPILQDRVCTHTIGITTAVGQAVTPCRFLLTGRCEDPASFLVDGTSYTGSDFHLSQTWRSPVNRSSVAPRSLLVSGGNAGRTRWSRSTALFSLPPGITLATYESARPVLLP